MLEISLDRDLREMQHFFKDLKLKATTTAARQALNRTATRTKSNSLKQIRKMRKAKLKDVKGFVKVRKAKGSNIGALESEVRFSGMPLPLIFFLVGSKEPKRQTVANRKRRPRMVQITPGKKSKRKGLFVEKAKRGKLRYRVFRRNDPSDKSKGFTVQSIPSIAETLRKKTNMLRKIENTALATLQKEYDSALAFQLSKLRL